MEDSGRSGNLPVSESVASCHYRLDARSGVIDDPDLNLLAEPFENSIVGHPTGR